MSSSKKPLKIVQKLIRQVWQMSRTITKKLMSFLLRGLLVLGRKSPRFSGAGFILPTVAMVLLVVALLTTAIVFRSMDRTKNASNVRINEKVLAAVSPAVDRAEAKIIALLADPTLPRSTPTDQALYQAMIGDLEQYTLGDETPLKLFYNFNTADGGINDNAAGALDNLETLATAWRFPVDTDNNGKFDSYSLYGIYFRNPTQSADRARSPLEARTPPVDNASGNSNCGAGTAASLVGASGWYKTSDGNLKKSFFVSAATVPITELTPGLDLDKYEKYTGNQGFAALEVQQDQARVPLSNNAVVYDDDLEITPGGGIKLNGRIMTNSNFFIGQPGSEVHFYQVSSHNSCFYTTENAKITVGGNVVVGSVDSTRPGVTNPVKVDLFKDGEQPDNVISVTDAESSVTNSATKASYNSKAYAERINYLVANTPDGSEPPDVTRRINAGTEREKALQDYYKERTRRVPVAEVPDANPDAIAGAAAPDVSVPAAIRPQDEWIYPADPATGAENNSLTLSPDQPPATDPELLGDNAETFLGDRILVGNGLPAKWWNNQKQKFVDYYNRKERQFVAGNNNSGTVTWDAPSVNPPPRTRKTQFVPLSDLGDTDRDGYWEKLAAALPEQRLDGIGGLRVVTGAGIYDPESPDNIFPPANRPDPAVIPITNDPLTPEDEVAGVSSGGLIVTMPDSMPMWQDDGDGIPQAAAPDKTGDLIMRATAVYHYRSSRYPSTAPGVAVTYPDPSSDDQEPIACVSSYYNPSTPLTAQNRIDRPDSGGSITWTASGFISPSATPDANGLSINGLTYQVPAEAKTPSASVGAGGGPDGNGVFSPAIRPLEAGDLRAKLNYQANLIYPNGRFVNEPLRAALRQKDEAKPLTLAHQSSIASAICALGIIDGSLATDESVIPHGTIYETSFLDARQVKAIEDPNQDPLAPNDYDLSIEERQPLEIRATVLDLDKLRRTALTGPNTIVPDPEYLLPDSGIIYATREDALLDLSTLGDKLTSPVDFILDPTRRPSAIMLVNGSTIARGTSNDYKQEEKGLILVSNLPAYVKADAQGFNLHQNALTGAVLEEFDQTLEGDDWSDDYFYTTRTTKSTSFACRNGQPGLDCNPGDLWRPATVLADSVTLLSNNFRFGFRNEGDYDLRKNVDTSEKPRLVLGGYDIDGDGVSNTDLADETQLRFDLNGDGDKDDTDVKETEITVSAVRRLNGFFDNNYLTSANWYDDSTGQPKDYEDGVDGPQGSSYVNNFVTPIQRRTKFPEYVMEMCQKPLVSQCQPGDWFTGNRDGSDGDNDRTLARALAGVDPNRLRAGTTVKLPPLPKDQGYPRRVAFQRDNTSHQLVLDAGKPIPIAVDGGTVVAPYTTYASYRNSIPSAVPNALWFKTTSDSSDPTLGGTYENGNNRPLFYTTPLQEGTTQQPLLVPVLQLHVPDTDFNPPRTVFPNSPEVEDNAYTTWMQTPDPTTTNRPTTFNLIIAAGDNPTRDAADGLPSEFNGGMPNFPNFLENWRATIPARISGSFIQFKRSSYATAPYVSKLQPKPENIADAIAGGIFNYPQNYNTGNSAGRSPYNTAPKREWGFDVGLLSQLPDAFSQRITTPSAGEPNKFYRELSQDDEWVKTLLCAKAKPPGGNYGDENAVNDANRPSDFCQDIGADN